MIRPQPASLHLAGVIPSAGNPGCTYSLGAYKRTDLPIAMTVCTACRPNGYLPDISITLSNPTEIYSRKGIIPPYQLPRLYSLRPGADPDSVTQDLAPSLASEQTGASTPQGESSKRGRRRRAQGKERAITAVERRAFEEEKVCRRQVCDYMYM